MVHCIAKNCHNRSSRKSKQQEELEKTQKISFHVLPKNAMKRRMWCEAMNISEASISQSATICSMHFQPKDFYNCPQIQIRLREDAIPCLYPTHTSTINKETQEKKQEISYSLEICKTQNQTELEEWNDYDEPPKKKKCNHSVTVLPKKPSVPQQLNTVKEVSQLQLLLCNDTVTAGTSRDNVSLQSFSKVSKYTAISPNRIYNSPEKMRLRQELSRTKQYYLSRIKVLQQRTRRMSKRMAIMKSVFESLKEKNLLQDEQLYNLKDIFSTSHFET
ncbi:uncharacterized protein LOC109857201 [Pseudomyrmex gracilis]|uniref:uncharacterized protein LOC109857201 n=1 Tax=Pseudomyrmex gracilis TaxID=219809 RepID=UPI000994C29D|nr:uncharacterized protein LOC109857201 [Pseudomyrmex gracilis]